MSTVATCATGNQRRPTEHVHCSSARSLCRTCKQAAGAKIQISGGVVYFDSDQRRRLGKVEEIAALAAWLALENTCVTGETMLADGGL
ncbi:hypothetical protein ACMHYB_28775 [Sorangium sp. So ce1128]